MRKLVIAGGGTGGHVLAGVAVADTWKMHCGEDAQAFFIGSRGGLEEKLVPRAGYSLDLLEIGSLNRVSLKKKVKTLFQLPLAFLKSFFLLLKLRPDAVLGIGGYSSGPVLMIAGCLKKIGVLKTKIAIIEQNSTLGFTNRVLCPFVDQVFVSFAETAQGISEGKAILTGNPIRSSMKPMPPARRDPFVIFVFGGSQGAIGINSLILEALPYLTDLKEKLRWIHQTGEKDFERVKQGHLQAQTGSQVEKFIYEMPAAYAQASLIVCRAGASTLAEIAAVGRASILIPLPTAADNHQEHNARIFEKRTAAKVLLQQNSNGEELARLIRSLFSSPLEISEMERNSSQFFRPEAATDVVLGLIG